METLLINEQFVSKFKYWQAGQVRSGMRFRNDLFEYVSTFDHQHRHQAFDLTWRLAQSGREPIVTTTSEHYVVWLNLRMANRSAVPTVSSTLPNPVPNKVIPNKAVSMEPLSSVNHELSLETALSA